MTSTILSSQLASVGPDVTVSEYAESLPEDLIKFQSILQYLNFVDEYKSGRRSQAKRVTSSELILDPAL